MYQRPNSNRLTLSVGHRSNVRNVFWCVLEKCHRRRRHASPRTTHGSATECALYVLSTRLRRWNYSSPYSRPNVLNPAYSTAYIRRRSCVCYVTAGQRRKWRNQDFVERHNLFTWLFSRLHQQLRSVTAPLNRFYLLWRHRNYRRIIITGIIINCKGGTASNIKSSNARSHRTRRQNPVASDIFFLARNSGLVFMPPPLW